MISHHNLLFYINNSILSLLLPIGNTKKEENKVLFIKHLKNNAEVVWWSMEYSYIENGVIVEVMGLN
ncbi:hypothetical protein EG882_04280 [Bacillus velezensis]|nr:hypothetical protein EG882_04280 [Bacillus velezensis]